MLRLSGETLRLAERLAAHQGVPVDEAVRLAIEDRARLAGVGPEPRRQSAAAMLAAGAVVAALPLLDPRSVTAIRDDLDPC